ncbi:50S ribosomal protein L10 [Halococcus saccharolyticus]|uniref:Large ribosomal subunit protein uL10 n=1 Tax=Halococcus saccharolyticus DSM 5350 TaxID=1227455 RepID=M0ML72_9EURY|nr:50S ribosomal protein L10 [Halococcus saccharolyticus]EMA45190.1 acidic ribosomal protein P0 [Halococcus saccharolyticus DSM 5350]
MSAESEAGDRQTEAIPEWKREEVADLADLIETYESVGVVSIGGIPSRQLQAMRRELHGEAELRVSRNTLLVRALEAAGEGVADLTSEIEGQVGLIGTDENPFGLYRQLEASKTPAPINAGEIAPNAITIPESDTGVDPGPFVGELQQVGAAARIMDGSIHVTEDSTVLEEGEEVSAQLANVLGELGIEPKEVGLDLKTVYADGILFEPDELAIDVDEYRADVEAAAARARNLSINAVYPTDRTAGALLGQASTEARSLGVHAAIESPDIADELVSKADAQVRALAAHIDDDEALPEELREQVVEESADAGADADADESNDDEADAETEPDADADDESDDDDDGDAGAGLGEMFG